MKKLSILLLASVVTLSNAAWDDFATNIFGDSCQDVPYDRADWGFESQLRKREILFEQAKERINIGDSFIDEYTQEAFPLKQIKNGKMISNAHVDHLIPLSYMHKKGGCNWPDSKKKTFANDRKNLKLTLASRNLTKGAKSPSEWLPNSFDQKVQIKYLNDWNQVAEKYDAPTFKLKLFKVKNKKFVNYTRKTVKGVGYAVGAAGLIFSGAGAAALIIPAAAEAADEVAIIAEDPDQYFSEIATDFSNAYDTSLEWSSSTWDATKEWSDESWKDVTNWSKDSWTNVVEKTKSGWEATKNVSQEMTESIKQSLE